LGTNPLPESSHTAPPNTSPAASTHKNPKTVNHLSSPGLHPTIPTTPKSQGTNSQINTPTSQSVQKATPETPPTSYAAAVICGPSAQPNKPPSQQNSPHVQNIPASPSLGPIGSPTNSSSGNPNISFGMMLPPASSSSTLSGGVGGANSLNNSAHGSSYYPPPQSSLSLFHNQNIDSSSHEKKLTTSTPATLHLLQHQEQFPPPTSSPMRSVTTNYPLPDHPHTQPYLQYPSPNNPSRGRAYTESFLFSMPSQKGPSLSFPLQHLTFSPSPDLPYHPLLPLNLDSNLDENLQSQQHHFQDPGPAPDDILSQSSWSPTSKKSSSGNRESQLENLFVSSRQDMERSVSLGGLGWMPSSLSSDSHPPESRRGVSDLGIGVGFGSGGLGGRDGNFGLDNSNVQPPPFVPSMSAWESFVDHSVNNSNQTSPQYSQNQQLHSPHHSPQHQQHQQFSPTRPHSYSLNHLYDGMSPNSRLHPPSPFGSMHSTRSDSVFSHQEGDENDNNYYAVQELRLQAPEYNPNNSSHSANSSSSTWR
jgi:hypothetical protein